MKRLKSGKYGGFGFDLNIHGAVVGAEYTEIAAKGRPAVWRGGEKISLPVPEEVGEDVTGEAIAINDDGVIIGNVVSADFMDNPGVRWVDDQPEILSPPEGTVGSSVRAINAKGEIAGTAQAWLEDGNTSFRVSTPAVWDDAGARLLPVPEGIASTDAEYVTSFSVAQITDGGLVAARIDRRHREGAGAQTGIGVIYRDDVPELLDLDEEGKEFRIVDLNDDGLIAGHWITDPKQPATVALWVDGGPRDLGELIPAETGLTLVSVRAVNNAGMIAAMARDADDVLHGVLLIPAR
jgi:hypothetical protein